MLQKIFLLIMLVLPVTVGQAQVAQEDSLALVALYQATDGANWSDNTNWLTGPVASWNGVEVINGRITVLSLVRNALTRSIPESIGNLTNLTELNLSENQLTGAIPESVGTLTNLIELLVNDNLLSGTLPLSLTNLSMLDSFSFDNTNLCEPIEPAFQAWLQGISSLLSTGCTNVATDSSADLPGSFTVSPNYPNPLNRQTTIRYGLPQTASVHLVVYDALGRRVRVLVKDRQQSGWHEVVFEADDLPSGVYFYRLEAGSFQETGRMLLVK